MTIDRPKFFDAVRDLFAHGLNETQVAGMSAILDGWEQRMPDGDLRHLAYMFATTFHETAQRMTPVREAYWLSEEWRKAHLRYYPYYGRGFVQLTWRENYARAGDYLSQDLVSAPDGALRPDFAAPVMFVGMEEGWFRADSNGRRYSLPRFFSASVNDPVGARDIINGKEFVKVDGQTVLLAEQIADYHRVFLRGLGAPAGAQEAVEPPLDVKDLARKATQIEPEIEAPAAPVDRLALIEATAQIVAGFARGNAIAKEDLSPLIRQVYATLQDVDKGE